MGHNFLQFSSLAPQRPPPVFPLAVAPNFAQTWQTDAQMNGPVSGASLQHDSFLTRLCQKCELIEMTLAVHRYQAFRNSTMVPIGWPALVGPIDLSYLPGPDSARAPNMREATKWQEYPWSSCTCSFHLGVPRPQPLDVHPIHAAPPRNLAWAPPGAICLEHRLKIWDALLAKRNANDLWLQNIHLRSNLRGSRNLRKATSAERLRRTRVGGYWRACRCGSEIDHYDAQGNETHRPQIFMCLACEGTQNDIGNVIIPGVVSGMALITAPLPAPTKDIKYWKQSNVDLGYSATQDNCDRLRLNLEQIDPS